MPRAARNTPGGYVYHVLNRAVGRMKIFRSDADYAAFERVLEETQEIQQMRICAWCLMPNHWHFVLWPVGDKDLSGFMQRLTNTHVRRWKVHKKQVGYGPLYQGRFKSFPVQTDDYFLQVVRYVERNALRANLVQRAEDWRWSSLWRRVHGNAAQKALLCDWPVARPRLWRRLVNQPETEAELVALRRAANRGQPFGSERWTRATAAKLNLESTLRARGRPKGPGG